MSNDLTDIPNVGPSRAETLRDAGFETKAEVEAIADEEEASHPDHCGDPDCLLCLTR